MFRRLVVEHPALFAIGVQHRDVPAELVDDFRADAAAALTRLNARLGRLRHHQLLDDRSIDEAACHFYAMCEGFGALELRWTLADDRAEQIWRNGLATLITGFRPIGS